MARGPFQGTWDYGTRPTVVTAPDAVIFINGESDIIGCGKCKRKFDFNKYVTSVQVDLNVQSAPGSASVNLSVPRHAVDKFFVDGNALVTPMMEIEIYAKGYFLVEGVPQYYPIFWGLVTEVTDSYSAGEHTISINCADILKWWELCRMNIQPAFTQAAGQLGSSLFGNVFFGMNPYDIIWSLAQFAFGDVVVGSGSLVSLSKEASQKSTFNYALTDMMLYWAQRFRKIRSNLLLYGTRGNAVRGDVAYATYQKKGAGATVGSDKTKNLRTPFMSRTVREANGGDNASQMIYDPTDPDVVAFRTQFQQAGQVNFWSSEFQTKLELANAAKESIGYEFYMDVTGDIVFKPPFYNLDVLSNKPVSWIQDIDIIDWSLADSEAEVITQIQIQGSFGGNVDYGLGEEVTPFTSVTDYHLLRKYGWRTQTFNSEFMGSPMLMFYTGMDLLDRYNSKRFNGSVTIPMRPELRLGFPVYLAPKDQIWYISGISHNLTFGGRAQTTLSLTAKRTKFIAPKGIGTIELTGFKGAKGAPAQPVSALQNGGSTLSSKQLAEGGQFKANIGDAVTVPPSVEAVEAAGADGPYSPLILRHPKTGRIVGYPNVVMAYMRPFQPPPESLAAYAGQKKAGAPRPAAKLKEREAEMKQHLQDLAVQLTTATGSDAIREKYLSNRYRYGLNSAGVFTYLYDKSAVIKDFVILKKSSIKFDSFADSEQFPGSGMIRPVSDERGFEVIGHFRYGRGVALRDGSLIINEGDANSQATVDTQLALSGGLFELLKAQSNAIGTRTTTFQNPAAAVTTLSPEDLQTAGIVNPNTGKPQFVETGTNFVDTAPLGSEEQAGAVNSDRASVEASQLSRALTVLELTVQDDVAGGTASTECECEIATSDLGFISSGYQLKTIGGSGTDTSTINFGSMGEEQEINAQTAAKDSALKALQEQKAAAEEAAVAANRKRILNDPRTPAGSEAQDKALAAADASARAEAGKAFVAANYDAYSAAGAEPSGVLLGFAKSPTGAGGGPALSPIQSDKFKSELTIAKVESFLTNLYTALDSSHQQWEKALRGEFIEESRESPSAVRFGTPQDTSPLSAPFNKGRSLGGNPEDLAKQGAEARDQLTEVWGAFAEGLAANTNRALLQGEIGQLTRRAGDLAADIAKLEAALASGNAVMPDQNAPGYSAGQTLKDLKATLAKTENDLQKKQQDLNALNAKYPP